jgi:hypothetical protein
MDEELKGATPEWAPRWPSDPALQLLADHLSRIFETQYPGTVKSNRREQYASALVNVTDFLEANDFPPFVVRRFKNLVVAIRDLDSGKVAAFLKPVSAGNRHVDASDVWLARAYAAIALDVLAKASSGQLEAQSMRIAKLFPGKATSEAVKKWRERFKNGEVKDHFAQGLFNNKAAVIETVRGTLTRLGEEPTASAISEIVLSMAVNIVSPVAGGQEPPAAG